MFRGYLNLVVGKYKPITNFTMTAVSQVYEFGMIIKELMYC